MAGGTNSLRWDKNLQHQQRLPNQRPGQQRPQHRRPNDYGGFDSSILGKICKFKLANGEVLQGLVSAASKFWYLVNIDGQVVIINKGYIISIMPVQSQNNKQSAGTLVGATGDPYGEKKA
jgi:sRNA-binding regulator protein Hfq